VGRIALYASDFNTYRRFQKWAEGGRRKSQKSLYSSHINVLSLPTFENANLGKVGKSGQKKQKMTFLHKNFQN